MHGIADPRLPAGRARPKDLPRGRAALTDDIEQQLAGGALAARGGAARLIDGGIGVAGRVGRSSEDEPDVADDCGPRELVQWAHHRRDIIILAPAELVCGLTIAAFAVAAVISKVYYSNTAAISPHSNIPDVGPPQHDAAKLKVREATPPVLRNI